MPLALSIYTDAGARGNPGPSAIAVLIFQEGKPLKQHSEYIGTATNNQAEYRAVIKGLELAKEAGAGEIRVFSDSELVCSQLKGEYKVKNRGLKPLYEKAKSLEKGFQKVSYFSLPRENPRTRLADRLVNRILDSRKAKS